MLPSDGPFLEPALALLALPLDSVFGAACESLHLLRSGLDYRY
jgi:hypothetical protein